MYLIIFGLVTLESVTTIYRNKKRFASAMKIHSQQTRGSFLLHLPIIRTSIYLNSLFYMGLKWYNRLPDSVRDSENFSKFRKEVKSLSLEISPYPYSKYLSA